LKKSKTIGISKLKKTHPKKLVNSLIKSSIVLAIAANKSDLYENEDIVPEQVGKSFAKEVNALFLETSAKSAAGVEVNSNINS
jgi:hypothetical protein